MGELRRWVPGPARETVELERPTALSRNDETSRKDLKFCTKLAFHGGIAVSEEGFGAESELVRLRQAGLLELQRAPVPPFAVTRVTLSQKARDLLAARNHVSSSGSELGVLKKALPIPDTTQERLLRRHGFEVARGMISAVVKTELASWNATEQGGESVAREAQVLTRIGKILETRILTRISQIASPFGP